MVWQQRGSGSKAWRLGVAMVALVAAAVGLWWVAMGDTAALDTPPGRSSVQAATLSTVVPERTRTDVSDATHDAANLTMPAPVSPLETVRPPVFRADAAGRLITDARMRADLEQVYALHHGPQVLSTLDDLSSHLPPQAQRDLRDMYRRYVQYDTAVNQQMQARQTDDEPTVETADQELQLLRELRRTYFGEELANSLFGEEEQQSIEMNDFIRHHTDPSLPLVQRVEQAQAAWFKAHGISAGKTPSAAP